jgi:hypothetical protein
MRVIMKMIPRKDMYMESTVITTTIMISPKGRRLQQVSSRSEN